MSVSLTKRTASDLNTGDTFVRGGETFTVSFVRFYTQTGIDMVRVYTDEKEMPFSFRVEANV